MLKSIYCDGFVVFSTFFGKIINVISKFKNTLIIVIFAMWKLISQTSLSFNIKILSVIWNLWLENSSLFRNEDVGEFHTANSVEKLQFHVGGKFICIQFQKPLVIIFRWNAFTFRQGSDKGTINLQIDMIACMFKQNSDRFHFLSWKSSEDVP